MKQKILIVYNFFYPGYKAGGPIRSLKNLCDALSSKFDIFIITGDRDLNSKNAYPNIKTNQWTKLDNYQVFYTKNSQFSISFLHKEIKHIKPNIIYLQSFFGPLTWKSVIASILHKNKRIIISPRGEFNKGALQFKSLKKKIFIKIIQAFGLFINMEFHATTNEEKSEISTLFKNKIIWTATNITDLPKKNINFKKRNNSIYFLFVSRISPKKNLDFLINIFYQKKFSKKIHLDIYGPIDDKKYWDKCLNLMSKLPENISCNYHGPIDYYSLNSIYPNYDFFILPTFGENFGHAIYSSLANGLPVIISNKTPWQDLSKYNAGYVLDINIDIFANTIQKCINFSDDERKKMKEDSLNYAQKFYNESSSISDTEKMFLGINNNIR